jgi:hypothetical protein
MGLLSSSGSVNHRWGIIWPTGTYRIGVSAFYLRTKEDPSFEM